MATVFALDHCFDWRFYTWKNLSSSMHFQAHFVDTFSPEYTFFLDDKQRVQRVNGFSFVFLPFFTCDLCPYAYFLCTVISAPFANDTFIFSSFSFSFSDVWLINSQHCVDWLSMYTKWHKKEKKREWWNTISLLFKITEILFLVHLFTSFWWHTTNLNPNQAVTLTIDWKSVF